MSRDHFAQMYRNKSHRHDQPHDSYGFDEAVGAICGMLYSIITFKAFFPKSPAAAETNNPIIHAAGGDQEEAKLPIIE
jgi:hypothetical protein